MQTTQRSRTKVIQVIVHTIAWAMMFCSPLFFSQGEGNSISWARYLGFCASPLAFMLVFYLNYFVLIDRLLFRKRLGTFVLINLLLIILLAVGLHGWHEFHRTYVMGIPPSSRPRARTQFYLFFMLRDAVTMLLVTGLSVAIKMTGRWYRVEREKPRRSKRNARRRNLQNLKSQLNPHFLFNTLNSIYALIAVSPAKAQDAVHELSGMLRYVLYDDRQVVELSRELSFVENYVKLMGLRLPPSTKLECDLAAGQAANSPVPPLLFIPLVENAFKHSNTGEPGAEIKVSIKAEGETLTCVVDNTCRPESTTSRKEDKSGGIGLQNLRRRLQLIYGNRASLETSRQNDIFKATLIIPLDTTNPERSL